MAELKHLLTAASEDRPPGIDLLDGLDLTARPRRARRLPAVLAGLTAGAVAAGVAIALTVMGMPQSAQAKVFGAIDRNEGKPYHVEMVTQAPGGDPFRLTGDFDPEHGTGRLASPDGGQIIMIGDTGYQRLPETMQSSKNMPPPQKDGRPSKTPAGWKPLMVPLGPDAWLKLPMDDVTWGFGSSTRSFAQDPQGELETIRSANRVEDEGPVEGPGWKGERYSFTTPSVKKWFGHEASRGTVDIDSHGDIRALDVTLSYPDAQFDASVHYKLTFSAYGTPITITPPQTSHLYTPQSLYQLLHGKPLPKGQTYSISIY